MLVTYIYTVSFTELTPCSLAFITIIYISRHLAELTTGESQMNVFKNIVKAVIPASPRAPKPIGTSDQGFRLD